MHRLVVDVQAKVCACGPPGDPGHAFDFGQEQTSDPVSILAND
jgi:hypothetical protein